MKEILESGITKVLMADSFQELSWQIGNYGKDVVWSLTQTQP